MKQFLDIALLQMEIEWENPVANLVKIDQFVAEFDTSPDMIILPEMFTTGFTMEPEKVAEPMGGSTIKWMLDLAQDMNCHLLGSVVIEEKGVYYNRLICCDAQGTVSYYDKKHLFKLAKEGNHYQAGDRHLLIECQGWRVFPLICYDLRFPVWSRNTINYDVLIYVANFPATRTYAWDQLLIARAIENQSYVCGVNRVGVDGANIAYNGHSAIISFDGQLLNDRHTNSGWIRHKLAKDPLNVYKRAYPFLADRDAFDIR